MIEDNQNSGNEIFQTESVRHLMERMTNPTDVNSSTDGKKQSMLRCMDINKWVEEASLRPDPVPLWGSLWLQGEVCCLFADSNVGKSIYAVQIANEIAKRRKVLYFDFEMTSKQVQMRYSKSEDECYRFPDGFIRAELQPENIPEGRFEDLIIAEIERVALVNDCRVIIVDNITYLNSVTEKGDAASELMIRLMQLKKRYDLSILVLAHTPKRQLSSPVTQNDLAGSKKLFNFFDSVFAIGKSTRDENLRYIKQLKVRAGAFEYDSDNVIVCEIVKEDGFLYFKTIGFDYEKRHIMDESEQKKAELNRKICELSETGMKQRAIAVEVGVSVGKVNKVLQAYRKGK